MEETIGVLCMHGNAFEHVIPSIQIKDCSIEHFFAIDLGFTRRMLSGVAMVGFYIFPPIYTALRCIYLFYFFMVNIYIR
jgi:hypothetical protein